MNANIILNTLKAHIQGTFPKATIALKSRDHMIHAIRVTMDDEGSGLISLNDEIQIKLELLIKQREKEAKKEASSGIVCEPRVYKDETSRITGHMESTYSSESDQVTAKSTSRISEIQSLPATNKTHIVYNYDTPFSRN